MAQYYYLTSDHQTRGPVDASLAGSYGLRPDTLVCPVGGNQWVPLSEIPELAAVVSAHAATAVDERANRPAPPSNLIPAIITTVLCCMPAGIIAIIYASRVKGLWASGLYPKSLATSRKAMQWCIISVICAVLFWIMLFVLDSAGLLGPDLPVE